MPRFRRGEWSNYLNLAGQAYEALDPSALLDWLDLNVGQIPVWAKNQVYKDIQNIGVLAAQGSIPTPRIIDLPEGWDLGDASIVDALVRTNPDDPNGYTTARVHLHGGESIEQVIQRVHEVIEEQRKRYGIGEDVVWEVEDYFHRLYA